MADMHKSLNMVLLGKAGVGKSATGNTILGQEAFISKKSFTFVTQKVSVVSSTVCGRRVTVYDTPAVLDSEQSEEKIQQIYEVLQKCESHPCAFLLVIKADRFTEEDTKTVENIEKVLGVRRKRKTWILITRGDQLEEDNMTIEEFISDNEALKKLLQKYDQRYCVFNNKNSGHIQQVHELLTKILETNCYTTEVRNVKQLPLKKKIQKSPSSRWIVLLGKSGVGKSAAGNTILGRKEFICMRGMTPVTSECSMKHTTVSGRSVSVVDTPGFFHTQTDLVESMMEIMRSVYISSTGPHAFLIVFRVDERVTDQELQIPQMIEMMFGEEVLKYSIILFTHGDLLRGETVEKLIQETSVLRDLIGQCGGRVHVFNNRDDNNRDQVNDLLKKIDTMIKQNGGGHYSHQMFEDAERFRREEEERRWRYEEEKTQREEKQRQEEIERVRKETEERIRAEYEGPPRFLQERLKTMRLIEEDWKRREKKRQNDFQRKVRQNRGSPWISEIVRVQKEMIRIQEEQKQEEIDRVIKETEMRIRAEFEGPPRFLLERFKLMRLREEVEKTHREEIERVRKETEKRIRAEFEGPPRFLQERLKAMRLSVEEEKTQREEIERVRKETEKRIRAEFEGPPRFLQERLKAMRLREEEKIRREVEQQDELERFLDHRISSMRRIEMDKEIEMYMEMHMEMRHMEMKHIRHMEMRHMRHMEMTHMEIRHMRHTEMRDMEMIHTEMQIELQEDIERVIKETEEKIRAEFEGPPNPFFQGSASYII